MPIFIDALLGDTLHLSAEEFGAYCLIMFATWRNNGQALADDDRVLARICRVSQRRWREKIRPRLAGFFQISDGFWHQKRLEHEWNFVQQRAQIARDNGARGGRPKYRKQNGQENPAGVTVDNPDETREQSTHTYTNKYINNKPDSVSVSARDGFPAETPWQQRCDTWAKGSRWLKLWGPAPDEDGCLAPPELVTQALQKRNESRPWAEGE